MSDAAPAAVGWPWSDRVEPRNTLAGVLADAAARWPEETFLRHGEEAVAYAELDRRVNQLSRALLEAGVERGDTVAVMMDNRVEYLAAIFAVARIGAVEISVNTAFQGDILKLILGQSAVKLLVCQDDYVDQVAPVLDRLPALREILVVDPVEERPAIGAVALAPFGSVDERSGDPLNLDEVGPTDLAQISYTSGTTGGSKGVMIPHNRIVQTGRDMVRLRGIEAGDVLYTCLPLFHGNAKYLTVVPAMLAGASVALSPRFSASGFWNDIRRYGATQFNYLGVMLTVLLKEAPSSDDRDHSLRMAWGGGAPPETIGAFEDRFGVTLIEAYGLTEAGVPLSNRPGRRRLGSCGAAIEGYEVQVVDELDNPVPQGRSGEIVIRSRRPYTTMLGYYEMPEATVAAFRNLWLHTGDLGRMDADGFVYFVDRAKDVIRRRGENISSVEIEEIVARHPAVREAAAFPVPSDLTDDDVMVVVHLGGEAAATEVEILEYCAVHMPYFWVPRYLRISERPLPRTQTNKIRKPDLRGEGFGERTWDRQKQAVVTGAPSEERRA